AKEGGPPALTDARREHDSLGERDVPNHAYYGVQTIRAMETFPFSGIHVSHYEHFVRALACVKKAAALANAELGALDGKIADAIAKACDDILAGKHHEQFIVDMIQGGAGTSTNMNANEVIANRALEHLGHQRGEYQHLHPLHDVNLGQSPKDVYPTAVNIALDAYIVKLDAALETLHASFLRKAAEFADVIKMGRTQLQDAVPMTLGQEFAAYGITLDEDRA